MSNIGAIVQLFNTWSMIIIAVMIVIAFIVSFFVLKYLESEAD